MNSDIKPEYMYQHEAARYLRTTEKKIATFRKLGLLKTCKFGKSYVFKRSWLDEFSEEWNGYDLSNTEKISLAINSKRWHEKHDGRSY